jgi:hypothetical protein
VINEEAKTIALTVPFGTDVTALVPTIVHTGASVSPASGATQDFTSPVNYTVTAEDTSTQAYLVTVTVALSSDATLKTSSTVKGKTLLGLGTPDAALDSATGGTVTITPAKAADTSNATTFITLFDPTDAGATVKVVKYTTGVSTGTFAADTAYTMKQ